MDLPFLFFKVKILVIKKPLICLFFDNFYEADTAIMLTIELT